MNSHAQIVATIGPSAAEESVLSALVAAQMDVVRLNFAWADIELRRQQIERLRRLEIASGREIPIIFDLPGSRIQQNAGHSYDPNASISVTPVDEEYIQFAAETGADYIALSFVGTADDVAAGRAAIERSAGRQRIIAKIERMKALENLDDIITASDAVMVARGDLGAEVPLERIPFVQDDIVARCKSAGKPVTVATQMMLSMTKHDAPTRAEVTDVSHAIMTGADAVMLSEETAVGLHPAEVVAMMERIIAEAEKHRPDTLPVNPLMRLK
jgi:pyruvate kinase